MHRRVVGDEAVDLLLDHRMAAALYRDLGLVDELRAAVVVALGSAGEGDQPVQLGQRAGDVAEQRQFRRQRVEQLLVQELLARGGAVGSRQRAVLEGFQFGRDVALGVLQRLPAAVVVRDALDVGVRDLDVEAVHAVVLDLQVGDAGALALARFERQQELAAVVLQAAQFVQFGVETGAHDATVAQLRGRFVHDGAGEQVAGRQRLRQRGARLIEQTAIERDRLGDGRQLRQRVAQAGKVARACGTQRDPRRDALDVGDAAQRVMHPVGAVGVAQRGHSFLTRVGTCALAQRVVQRAAQPARTHRGGAGVEQRQQRR